MISHVLVVAGGNYEEGHVDYIEQKHDNLCSGRPFNFLDWPCESETLTASGGR